MKTPRRLDRPVCGVVLSSGLPRPSSNSSSSSTCSSASHPATPRRRVPVPCLTPKKQQHGLRHNGMPCFSTWILAGVAGAGVVDPASGTLLPMLCPAWKAARRTTAHVRGPAQCFNDAQTYNKIRTFSAVVPPPRRPYSVHSAAAAAAAAPEPESDPRSFAAVPGGDDEPVRPRRRVQTQEDLLAFVDPPEDGDTVDAHLEYIRDPYMRRYATAAEPQLLVKATPPGHKGGDRGNGGHNGHNGHGGGNYDDDEEAGRPTWADLDDADEHVRNAVHALNHAVWRRLHNPHKMSAAQVYEHYRQLPGPARMAVIPFTLRHRLFKALGMVEKKSVDAMLRFFAVVADARECGLPLWRAEWNAAMSFAGRYVGDATTTTTEMEAAMQLWREMERDVGIKANDVTFNILFDVASKAGNFALAEMIYLEMERRGFAYSRYHSVSLIHLFGLKLDADGVRAAYREMVLAGEMIDVVVLNCVIVGFLRSGEEDAAERVYRTMFDKYRRGGGRKREDDNDTDTFDAVVPLGAETPNFASFKLMTDVLTMLARVSRHDAGLRERYQFLVPTRPDLGTYRILVVHHAVRVGNLTAVVRYLNDMKLLRIPLHGSIFLALFKGFAIHGGRPGTRSMWSERRLRGIWAAFLRALDDKVEGLYISRWMMRWSLRAFSRCSTPEMVFKAYNSLTLRWDMTEEDADFSIAFLHRILKHPRYHYTDLADEPEPWDGSPPSSDATVMGSLGRQSFKA